MSWRGDVLWFRTGRPTTALAWNNDNYIFPSETDLQIYVNRLHASTTNIKYNWTQNKGKQNQGTYKIQELYYTYSLGYVFCKYWRIHREADVV